MMLMLRRSRILRIIKTGSKIDPNSINAQELISRYQKRADENKQAIDAARQILSINNDISKDAWDEIQRWKDSLSITNAEKAAK